MAPAVSSVTPAQGPVAGGTRVTVKGSGFGTRPVVLFGSVLGTAVTVKSPGVLLVTAPRATAAGQVCVRVRVGTRTSAVTRSCAYTYRPVPSATAVTPPTAPLSGQRVTIDGTGFFAPVKVTFGGLPATSVSLVSKTRLTAQAPAGSAGTVPVRVTTAGGTSPDTPADDFTYLSPGPVIPAIAQLTPNRGPAPGGTLISLRGSGFRGATQVLIDGVPATDLTVESDRTLRARVPAGPEGDASVVVVGPDGSSEPMAFTRLPAPSPAQNPAIVGLTDRFGVPQPEFWVESEQPLVDSAVVDVRWAAVEPDPDADLELQPVLDKIALAREGGLGVRLRIFAGSSSPTWVRTLAGSMQWEETHTGTTRIYTVPKWWIPAYGEAYERFLTRLQAALGADPAVREVTSSRCMTVYAEPFIRQTGATNLATIKGTTYTYLDDLDCIYRDIDATARIWPGQRITLAVNPFAAFLAPATDRRQLDAIAAMTYCRGTLGDRCVLGNNSLRGTSETAMTCPSGAVVPVSGLDAAYDQIYCTLHDLGGPTYFQTARPAAIGDWHRALDRAVQYGAWSVELNVDYPTYDRVELSNFAAQIRANAED